MNLEVEISKRLYTETTRTKYPWNYIKPSDPLHFSASFCEDEGSGSQKEQKLAILAINKVIQQLWNWTTEIAFASQGFFDIHRKIEHSVDASPEWFWHPISVPGEGTRGEDSKDIMAESSFGESNPGSSNSPCSWTKNNYWSFSIAKKMNLWFSNKVQSTFPTNSHLHSKSDYMYLKREILCPNQHF